LTTAHGGTTRPADSRETGGTFWTDTTSARRPTMNADFWIEIAIILLRILAAGIAG
jgi:hypothetical protein